KRVRLPPQSRVPGSDRCLRSTSVSLPNRAETGRSVALLRASNHDNPSPTHIVRSCRDTPGEKVLDSSFWPGVEEFLHREAHAKGLNAEQGRVRARSCRHAHQIVARNSIPRSEERDPRARIGTCRIHIAWQNL